MPRPNKLKIKQEKEADAQARFAAHNKREVKSSPLLVDRVKDYKEFFIRDESLFIAKTKSSNYDKQILELVRHVFQKYPVPSFMNYVWSTHIPQNYHAAASTHIPQNYHAAAIRSNKQLEHELWYICVATGGSLHKQYLKEFLTKQESHLFLNCKFDLKIPQAIVFAIAKSSGAKDGNALRVARSKIGLKPLRNEFWKHAIRFFAQENDVTVTQLDDLIDYLDHKLRENREFTVAGSGQTVHSLLKKMDDWHRDLRRMKAIGNIQWEGVAIPDQTYHLTRDGNVTNWNFKQITSSRELQQEGNAQRHCVLSYKDRCIQGHISIWSLTAADEYGKINRKLTIELTNSGSIVQARGLANRIPRPEEKVLMERWAKDHGLSYNIRNYY